VRDWYGQSVVAIVACRAEQALQYRSLSFYTRYLLTLVCKPSIGRSFRVVQSRRADKSRTEFLTPHIIAQRVTRCARTIRPREQVVGGADFPPLFDFLKITPTAGGMSRTVSPTLPSAQKHVLEAGTKACFLDEK
jgi:hypothetical protein